jgi:hypothetical protein
MRSQIALLTASLLLMAVPATADESGVAMAAVDGKGPIAEEAVFDGARAHEIALLPQQIATPHAPSPAVARVEVRAVRNEDHAGFLLVWRDETKDVRATLDGFADMAAIAFPSRSGDAALPAPFMGNPDGRVQILQWRADWQRELETGPTTMRDIYPNAYEADFYHEDHLPPAEAQAFRGAAGLGSPMSGPHETSVQDLVAEGFGSLTAREEQVARGSARHDGATWRVVITRPLAGDEASAPSLTPGTRTQLAVAVWGGGSGEVGARKGWAGWVPLTVAE